jgi:excisionase family DNA binding protein
MTPDQVAEVWACSPSHVRNLIKTRKLRAFALGRLLRIPVDAIEEYEKCQMQFVSEDLTDSLSSHGGKVSIAGDIVLTHSRERQRKPKL